MIIKRGDGFWVLSDKRDKIIGGPYRTREEAERVFRAANGPKVQPAHVHTLAKYDDIPWGLLH